MSLLKFSPITKDDIRKSKSIPIQSVIQGDSDINVVLSNEPDVISRVPYDLNNNPDSLTVEDNLYFKSTHIMLSIPIVNVFLAGIDYTSIKRIVGDKYNVEDLASGRAVLRILDNNDIEVVHPDSIKASDYYDSEKYLLGGEAVREILKRVQIDKEIDDYLYTVCKSVIGKDSISGSIVKDNGDVWIIDKYYLNLDNLDDIGTVKSKADTIREKLLVGNNSKGEFLPRITALLSFRDRRDIFLNLVQDVIPILPLGFRPSVMGKEDPLSILYNRLIKANIDLRNCLITPYCKLNQARLKYESLYRAYLNLVYKKSAYDDDRFQPLIKLLTGKQGIIRKRVQSATIDFSGRSVITVDPNMPVDCIGIPEDMALQLCELDAIREFKYTSKNKSICLTSKYKDAMVKKAKECLEESYVVVGRQPTLYLLGMQGFRVKVVKGFSIVLNPIVTPAFNADFDGDQMYVNMPQSPEAREEVKKLMANVNNIYRPRDGVCHLTPRQEMIYGLYKCYYAESDVTSRTVSYANDQLFIDSVCNDLRKCSIKITDRCVVDGVSYPTVGYAALKLSLGPSKTYQKIRIGVTPITADQSVKEKCVSEEFFRELFKEYRSGGKVVKAGSISEFSNVANNYVRLGFTVANLYPPDINVLSSVNTDDIKKEFDESIKDREEWYNLGFDTEDSFSLFYSSRCTDLEEKVLKRVKSSLGKDNGFIQLIESGARGSDTNLLQLFGMKGIIIKNQAEAFNAIIKTPLSDQLSGLEHFVTAYGARQGVIDKSIGTYKPGYLSRQMSHVCRHIKIRSLDCGTTEGIHFTYKFLKDMLRLKLTGISEASDYMYIKEYTVKILEGRYIVGSGNSALTKEGAESIFVKKIAELRENGVIEHEGIKVRSPITCKDQCCVKCYGKDLTTNRDVVRGTAIGYLASQSIGEPVTQLIMKNFQKGGVAGNKNLTSSFDTLSDLLGMFRVSKIKSSSEPIIHDFISPVEGYVKVLSRGDGTGVLNIIGNSGKNLLHKLVIVYEDVKLKEYVKVGEPIQLEPGELDVNEILEYRGVDDAQMYMLFHAYNIFVNEVFVNFKHFEVLVNGMTLYLCTKGNDYFRVGNYYTIEEHHLHNTNNCEFIKIVRGLKEIPKMKNDFLTAIYLEDVGQTVSRNVLTSGMDSLEDPLVRVSLGLTMNSGTGYSEDYMKLRGV